jgi:hypothetical protein
MEIVLLYSGDLLRSVDRSEAHGTVTSVWSIASGMAGDYDDNNGLGTIRREAPRLG